MEWFKKGAKGIVELFFRPCGCLRACGAESGFTLIEILMGASILAVVLVALGGALTGQSFLNDNARSLGLAMNDATRVMEEIRRQNASAVACAAGIPTAAPFGGTFNSWNAWLQSTAVGGGGGKSVQTSDVDKLEVVAVTCQDGTVEPCTAGVPVSCADVGTVTCPAVGLPPVTCQADGRRFAPVAAYCGSAASGPNPAQIGADEWAKQNGNTTFDPIRVTVSVGWSKRQRVMGGGSQGNEFAVGTRQVTSGKTTTTITDTLAPTDTNANGVIDSQAMLNTLVTCR